MSTPCSGPARWRSVPSRIDGDRAHGPGVGDEKAGVVNAITALKILHDIGFKNFATITLAAGDQRGTRLAGTTQADQNAGGTT